MNKKFALWLLLNVQGYMLMAERDSLPVNTQRDIVLAFINQELSFRGVPMTAWSSETKQAVGQEIAAYCVEEGQEAMAFYLERDQGLLARLRLGRALSHMRLREMEYQKKVKPAPSDDFDRRVYKMTSLWQILHENHIKQVFKRDEATKYTF